MKKLLAGLALMFATTVNAGFVEDSFKAGSTEEMCWWAGNLVMTAVKKRLDGVPLVIKDAKERISPNPQDAIYIYHWAPLDDSDKVFYKKFIELGYGIAERAMAVAIEKNASLTFPDSFQGSYNAFMGACYEKKNTTEDWFSMSVIKTSLLTELIATVNNGGITKVGSAKPLTEQDTTEMLLGLDKLINEFEQQAASNGNLGKEPIGTEEAHDKHCDELYYDINLIARFISEGETQGFVLGIVHNSVGDPNIEHGAITQERADRLDRQVKEAYALTTPIADWMAKEWAECRGK